MNDSSVDDWETIRAAARGDAVAFTRLYDAQVGAVTRRVSHLVGARGGVDDLVQETFVRAMRTLPRFRGECPLRYWLLRIATSVVRDEERRARRPFWQLFAGERVERVDPRLRADAYADLTAVHRALAKLSPKLREVVVLFELEGATLAELATELAIPLHTVASRLRRGREQLRAILQREGFGDLVPSFASRGEGR